MADIQIPSFANVGGASFAPAYAKGNVDTSTGVSAIPELAKAAGSALTQIVQYENDNAFFLCSMAIIIFRMKSIIWLC